MKLSLFPDRLAVCRLNASDEIPQWPRGVFVSITRTPDELSIICDESAVPEGAQTERGWRAFQVHGPIPFEVTGVASGLTGALAANGISVFLIATYDTDWLLVKESTLERATAALRAAGYEIA